MGVVVQPNRRASIGNQRAVHDRRGRVAVFVIQHHIGIHRAPQAGLSAFRNRAGGRQPCGKRPNVGQLQGHRRIDPAVYGKTQPPVRPGRAPDIQRPVLRPRHARLPARVDFRRTFQLLHADHRFAQVAVSGILRCVRNAVRVALGKNICPVRRAFRAAISGNLRVRGFAYVVLGGILHVHGFTRAAIRGILHAARGFVRVSVAGILRAARGFARVSVAGILRAARGFVCISVIGMFRAARGFARVSVAGILRAARGFVRVSVAGILRAARGFVFVAIISAVGVFVHLAGFQANEDEVHAHGGLRGVFAEKMQVFARAPRVHLARLSHEHGALLAGVHRKNALPQKHGRVGSPGKLFGTMIAPAVQRAVRRKRQRKIAPARDRNDVFQHLHRLRHARVRAPGHAFPAHIGAPRPHAALLIHGQRMRAARRNRRKPLRDRAERHKQRRADCQYFSRHTHVSSPRVHPPERASFAHILPTRIRFHSTCTRRPPRPPRNPPR